MKQITISSEFKLRYAYLDSILKSDLTTPVFSNTVNIIIDLKSCLRKYFRPGIIRWYDIDNNSNLVRQNIASDIINIISHYRNYFFKHNKYSNFYFVYSREECQMIKDLYPDYKSYYYSKHMRELTDEHAMKLRGIVNDAVDVISKVTNMIPNSIFIDSSKFDEFLTIRRIIENSQNHTYNLILTYDEVIYQLVNRHTKIINLKGQDSKLVDEKNVISELTKGRPSKLSNNMGSLILSLKGCKDYSIKNITGFATFKSLDFIEEEVKKGDILDITYTTFPILDKCNNEKVKGNLDLIKNNYEELTLNSIYYKNGTEIDTTLTKAPQKLEKDYLINLNSKIFTDYPLLIEMIMKGEQ